VTGGAALTVGPLESHLRARREGGRRLLVPYVTGGISPDWTDCLRAYVDAGADAIEIGLPFSDPMLDGLTIQEASNAALARGATTRGILAEVAVLDLGVPLVAMTYCNLLVRDGAAPFCAALRYAGISGLIVPDLPLEEVDDVEVAAAAGGLDLVLLASPATPGARLREIAERSRGFVYAVSLMGTTGERSTLGESATGLASRLRRETDRPVLLGFGISTPEQAAAAARHADGVVIASRLMRGLLDGASPAALGAEVARVRGAIDG
jgi:tryptophan synthase alpha chain